jgi:hypothetical protein
MQGSTTCFITTIPTTIATTTSVDSSGGGGGGGPSGVINHSPGTVADVHFYVSDVISGVNADCRENIRGFVDYIEEWTQTNPITLQENCFLHIVATYGVYNITELQAEFMKEKSILCALWVIFLRVYRMTLTDESLFKYKCIEEFIREYNDEFDMLSRQSQYNLYYTAQWMQLCQVMLPARRNKGFYMSVIPKVIEGFQTKYVTGSGQSKATSFRVKIFEHEGSVKKRVNKRKSSMERAVENMLRNYAPVTASAPGFGGVPRIFEEKLCPPPAKSMKMSKPTLSVTHVPDLTIWSAAARACHEAI